MRLREIQDQTRRVLVIGCDKGDEAVGSVTHAIREHGIRAAQVTAVGGFQSGEIGYFDRNVGDYLKIPIPGQVEVLSLIGDVAELDGQPVLHAHAVLGRPDGSTIGGHLLNAQVWPTLEVIVTEIAPVLAKRVDPETGLALWSPEGQS